MMVPNVKGRTVTTSLMRDAVAAQARFELRNSYLSFEKLNPRWQEFVEMRYGGPGNIGRIIARGRVDSLKRAMARNPVGLYHKIFASEG